MAISIGTVAIVDASANIDNVAVARISDTQMLCTFENTNTVLGARVLDITTATKTIDTVNAENLMTAYADQITGIVMVELSTNKFLSVCGSSGDAHAQVLNVSGTTVTGATETVLSIFTSPPRQMRLVKLTSTTALFLHKETTIRAFVLSIDGSDNITAGAELVVTTIDVDDHSLALYSPTKAIYSFADDTDSGHVKGQLITISGTTVAKDGGLQTLDTTNTAAGSNTGMAAYSSTEIVLGSVDAGNDFDGRYFVVTLSGSTLTAETAVTVPGDAAEIPVAEIAVTANNTTILFHRSSVIMQVIKSGTSLAYTNGDFVSVVPTPGFMQLSAMVKISDDFAMYGGLSSAQAAIIESSASAAPTAGELTIAPMTKPADIDASGTFVYIAAIDSQTFPTLIKIATSLSADGSIVFQPSAGDNIGVQCGRFDNDVVWIGGNFDSTNKLEKSENAGTSFAVKDDATFADIEAFVVGPDSDDRVLVADETIEIQETVNDGDTWTQINASVGFNINAIARLAVNVEESIFGNDLGVSNAITYSVNRGDDMEDFTTGVFPTTSDVTGVIVN